MNKRLIVIGGGASGFFCALNARSLNPGLEVVIVEKTSKILSKVRISGGGRCNVTHECFEVPVMAKRYPRGQNLVKKSFHQFFTTDTIEWFRERGVLLKAEADGRMFPVSNSSQTIIDCLVREMNRLGVQLLYNKEVKSIRRLKNLQELVPQPEDMIQSTLPSAGDFAMNWELAFADGFMSCDYVCVACGGYPKASSFAWLAELGHKIEEPVPSLFTFNMPGHPVTGLMGISVESVQVKIVGSRLLETGPLLITHWGLSGPAILKLSAWGAQFLAAANYQFRLLINWLPGQTDQSLREFFSSMRETSAGQKISGRNPFGLPQRLWLYLLIESGCKEEWRWGDLPSLNQNRLISSLITNEYAVSGKTTFKEEFVTAGGIDLSGIDPNTMESRFNPGLYFAGEVMNVDGITGGYNFQHAWTSGFVAAKAIAGKE